MKEGRAAGVLPLGRVLVACALGLLPAVAGHAQGMGSGVSPAFVLDTGPSLDSAVSPAFVLDTGPSLDAAVSPAFVLDTRSNPSAGVVQQSLPVRLALHPARPNPFTSGTALHFDLPVGGQVRLEVFDVAGRRVRTLVDAVLPAGPYARRWDGRGNSGSLRAGVYFARLQAPGGTLRRKLVRLN